MKKNTAIYASTCCIILILITTAFTLEKNGGPIINKFGKSTSCGTSKNKNPDGSQYALTQSAHDQTTPGTCASCHSGGSATPVPSITFSPALGTNNTYTPGTSYTVSYTVTGYPMFGFDLEMNDGNTTTSMTAGILTAGTNTRLTSDGSYPDNITQSTRISTGSSGVFTWKAPSTVTTVYLFSNALGVNGSGTGGDKEVFKNMVLTSSTTPSAGIETFTLNTEIKLFPNPAKETTTLDYYLNKDSHVTINITDLNGKVVSTQINEEATEGSYSKKLELSELNSGTYFVKIKSDDNTVSKKLVIQ